jgi:hypothetical protein
MTSITIPAIGGLVAGVLASIIAILVVRRRVPVLLACLRGQVSTGRVLRVDRNEASKARLQISFSTSDGRELDYLEPLAIKGKVGEHVRVRYRKTDPVVATTGRPRDLLVEMLVFGGAFGVGGIAVIFGSSYSLVGGDRQIFYGLTGFGFFGLIGSIFLYVAGQSIMKARSWRRMAVADGLVKRVKPRNRADEYPHPLIAYKSLDGSDVEYWDAELSGYSPGDKVPVYYDPDYPEFTSTGVEKSGHVGQGAFYGFVGVLFVAGCAWFAWTYLISPS